MSNDTLRRLSLRRVVSNDVVFDLSGVKTDPPSYPEKLVPSIPQWIYKDWLQVLISLGNGTFWA